MEVVNLYDDKDEEAGWSEKLYEQSFCVKLLQANVCKPEITLAMLTIYVQLFYNLSNDNEISKF